MKKVLRTIPLAMLSLVLLLSACTPQAPQSPTQALPPTQDSAALQSTADALGTQVAGTVMSGLTATALANPTNTPEPPTPTPAPSLTPVPATSTPVPTIFVPTSTRIVVLPSLTPTQGDYQCQVTAQSPSQWANINPGSEFDARWTIKNVGTKNWPVGEVDYYYIDGQAMQKRGDAFDLNKSVNTGKTVDIVLDMTAPGTSGYYTTTWGLRYNGTLMCTMKVEITVR